MSTRGYHKPLGFGPSPAWMDQSECLKHDPELWHPIGQNDQCTEARRICKTQCSVRTQCLQYALDAPVILGGIWGGISENERRVMRRQRRKAAS